ncbi:hypothetical protein T10_9950 [Trichinella papuae]|uniref:Uncharacterized protein n=1 Tax=Trichinella papuae TaxID=268474 RepID=A0A0V1N4H3_9BILA|nr:hypothetical protein T10_9950 [Trichinella papuae]
MQLAEQKANKSGQQSEREKETAHRTLTMIHVLAQRSLADHCFERFGRLQALVRRFLVSLLAKEIECAR